MHIRLIPSHKVKQVTAHSSKEEQTDRVDTQQKLSHLGVQWEPNQHEI